MAAVHEDMQQRAGEQEQPWQPTQGMGAVLAEQEKSGDCGKSK
jgi:hypothetical protein